MRKVGDDHDEHPAPVDPEVIGAGPTGPARTTGLLYLGLAVTGALGFRLVRGQIYVADDPGGTLSTWSNTRRWRLGIVLELGIVLTQALAGVWFYRLFRSADTFTAGLGSVFGMVNAVAILGSAAVLATALDVADNRSLGLEPVGGAVEEGAGSMSRSAVSRKFVAMTEHALGDLLGKDLSDLDLVALMIGGVHFADHLCVVALGIAIDGTKPSLALVEGSTENTTLVRGLLVGLRERGLDVTRPILAVLDGAQGVGRGGQGGLRPTGDRSVSDSKLRNVRDHLPEKMRGPVAKRMRAAYHADSAFAAQALLEALARELDKTHRRCRRQPARGPPPRTSSAGGTGRWR